MASANPIHVFYYTHVDFPDGTTKLLYNDRKMSIVEAINIHNRLGLLLEGRWGYYEQFHQHDGKQMMVNNYVISDQLRGWMSDNELLYNVGRIYGDYLVPNWRTLGPNL